MDTKRKFQGLKAEELKALRGYGLRQLIRTSDRIPESPGIYIWRYWPSFKSLASADLIESLKKWSAQQPAFVEVSRNFRVESQITRRPFGFDVADTLLGIDVNSNKGKRFLTALRENVENRELLINVLDCIVCFASPLYVGKADNLRSRLEEHIGRKSNLLSDIESQDISFEDIYVSFVIDPISAPDSSITTGLEEILQRLTNPPLTKRVG
ncbi:GIY-YIG nuclease family protein [Variovorax saccharolyticus]|uniref:GIY-YIG nuclease family protein n=1 Tax=Variovorax saccharolyticus TaxID=3053516 RepID=UPI002576F6D6|nr:GIY-YIG nuclease family protein [Variovorax sp. J31P216]MDM0025735.1 GIY-YIG nuclease family protein [Variovorax sp. J31P216]